MKIERFFSKLLLVAVLCTFCACSSDDDEDLNTGGSGQGSISLNIGGTNINLNNVYWASEANDDNTTYYELQFMSFDMYAYQEGGDFSSFPSSYSVVYLSFDAPGSPSELPVGTFSEDDYDLSGALDMTLDNEEGRYYVEEGSASSDLVITRDGNNYTISIPSLEIVYSDPKEVGSGRWNSTTVNWNYTGTVKKASQY